MYHFTYWEDVCDEVIEYFRTRKDEYIQVLEDLDSEMGYLDGRVRCYDMDDYDWFIQEYQDEYHQLYGNDIWYSDYFDWQDPYFYMSEDGILHSVSNKEQVYDRYLNSTFVEELYQQYTGMYGIFGEGDKLPKYVKQVFDDFVQYGETHD